MGDPRAWNYFLRGYDVSAEMVYAVYHTGAVHPSGWVNEFRNLSTEQLLDTALQAIRSGNGYRVSRVVLELVNRGVSESILSSVTEGMSA